MLFREQIPYLLTILFAALAWTTNQIWDDISKSPTIEYKFILDKSVPLSKKVRITNISSDHLFSNLVFKVRSEKGSDLGCITTDIAPFPPVELRYSKSPNIQNQCEHNCSAKYAEFKIPHLQPGSSIMLIMESEIDSVLTLGVWSESKVRLVNRSLETILIKNRFIVLVYLFIIWILSIGIYVTIVSIKNK